MIHSLDVMSRLYLTLSILFLLFAFSLSIVYAQNEPAYTIEILSPLPGEAVQGLAQIVGTVDIEGFESYTLEFAFQNAASQNWFLITESSSAIINGVLGEWDTSLLVDDNYDLRLIVFTQDGESITLTITGLRVRNYSAIETSTPTPTPDEIVLTPTAIIETTPTPTATPHLTPTPLPNNQAAISLTHIQKATQNGLIIGFLFIVFVLFYQSRLNKNN